MSVLVERFLLSALAAALVALALTNPMGWNWNQRLVGAVLVVAVAGFAVYLSHHLNRRAAVAREGPSAARRVRSWKFLRRFRGKQMLPIIGIVVGGLLVIGCAVWLYVNSISRTQQIQDALKRYVLPRHLSEEQIAKIADYLSQHSPQRFKMLVVKRNEEASSLRADIQTALTRGGWTVIAIDSSDDVQEGISTNFQQTQAHAQAPPDPKNPKPDQLLLEAFKIARVRLSGSGGGSGIGVTEDILTISIGHRRMDDGDLTGRKQLQERLQRMLDDQDQE